jgi:DNA-binding transcriptional LysR family regulator
MVDDAQDLMRAAELVTGGESGLIRLGVGLSMKRTLGPRLIQQIAERHPRLDLLMEVGDRYQLLPALAERRLDIVFCALDPILMDSGMEITELLSSFAVVVAAPGHPLAGERNISPARLGQFPSAGPRNAAFTADAVYGVTPSQRPVASYAGNDWELLMALVETAKSTILLPAFEAAPLVRSGTLCRLDIDLGLSVTFVAAATRSASASPLLQKIVGYARDIAGELEQDQESVRAQH